MIVYCVTNLLTGKRYVGQTRHSLALRWRQHCKPSSKGRGIVGAIKKYGKENFSIELLGSYTTLEALNAAECRFIADLGTLVPNGYNLTSGGNSKKEVSAESRALLSSQRKGQRNSPKTEFKPGPRPETRGAGNNMFGKTPSWAKSVRIDQTNEVFSSVAALASHLEVSRSYVSRLLSGKSDGQRVKGFTVSYVGAA